MEPKYTLDIKKNIVAAIIKERKVTTNYCEQNLPKNTDLGFFTADRLFFSSKFATLP